MTTCPLTTEGSCQGDLAPLRIPELERAVRERFPNGRWWVDMTGKGDWTWDPYPYENYDPTDPDGPARPDNDLSTLLDLPGMFLLEKCPVCFGRGRRSTWVNELGREVEGLCPDCESGYRKALVCERHRGMLTDPPKFCEPVESGERPLPKSGYQLFSNYSATVTPPSLPRSLYQEPNRVLARELGVEVTCG